jgi:enoyl-CoA hydratase
MAERNIVTMQSDVIDVVRHGDVALIVLNRPAARNAMNMALASATVEAVAACQDAAAIVLTGTDPAFCAGLDLRDLGVDRLTDLPEFTRAVAESDVPTIAAVNGPAVTGGFELALACDFIIASERAAFADTHLRVGVFPGPVLIDLPRRVGVAWAHEMSLTGNFIDAATALRIGLANHVVSHGELVPFALSLAGEIAEQDRTMVAAARQVWRRTAALPYDEAHRLHRQSAAERGFRTATGETLAGHRDSVLQRARSQRLPHDC